MINKEPLPDYIPGSIQSVYGGFWNRLGAAILDFLFLLPFSLLILYLNSLSFAANYLTIIPSYVFVLWYEVYFVKKRGGTPGKLIAGLTILKLNGDKVQWREAALRYSAMLALSIFSTLLTIFTLSIVNKEYYMSLGWKEKGQYLMSIHSGAFTFYTWASQIWIWSEFIVLLTNKKGDPLTTLLPGRLL